MLFKTALYEDPTHLASLFGLVLTYAQLNKLDLATYYLE